MTNPLAKVVLVAVAMIAAPQAAAAEVMSWTVDGDNRQAIVHAPSNAQGGKSPLVFLFHGAGGSMEKFESTEMHRAWPEAIVVYFQGLPDPQGSRGWQVEKGQDNDRDLKMVDVALASLRKKFNVDDTRIYSTGFSQGASFTYLLWAHRPDVFAAYALVAGRRRESVLLKQPKPLFLITGTADPSISLHKAAIDTARRLNGVMTEGESCGDRCTIYGSASASPVMTFIHDGGHVVPEGAADRIAKFFRDHPRGRT